MWSSATTGIREIVESNPNRSPTPPKAQLLREFLLQGRSIPTQLILPG